MDEKDNKPDAGQLGFLGPDEYQRMNEKEKDAAIERAIIRLQSKIRTMLYLTETEKARRANSEGPGKKNKNALEKEG